MSYIARQQIRMATILRSQDNKDNKDPEQQNVPKGFEKFFRKKD